MWHKFHPMPDIPNMQAYLDRGHAVHAWTEQMDEGNTVRPPHPYESYCEAYKSFCYAMAPSWTHVEQAFDNGERGWHGIIDRVGYIKGHDALVIADIKTGKGQGKDTQVRVATQLASYAMGWKPHSYREVLRVGIFLHANGEWRTVVYQDEADFDRWRRLLAEAQHGDTNEEHLEKTLSSTNQVCSNGSVCDDHRSRQSPTGIPHTDTGAEGS